MNAWLTTTEGFVQSIVDAPAWAVLLAKTTAILLAAWLVHAALLRANPRWRVLLWRVTAVGLIALPAVASLMPAINVHVEQAAPITERVDVPTSVRVLPAKRDVASSSQGGFASDSRHVPSLPQLPMPPTSRPDEAGVSLLPQPQVNPPVDLPAAQKPSLITAPRMLLAAWLGGIGVLACRLCYGYYRLWRLARYGMRPPQRVLLEFVRVAQTIGCRVHVEVVQSAAVQSPLLCGLRRVRLLLPAAMCDEAYSGDLPAIFAHELAHVRSRDVLWNLALHLISVALWFHPFAWWMRRAHMTACELVADAVSASFVGDVNGYCQTLARAAIRAYTSVPATGIAMARRSSISRRLSALKRKVFSLPLRRRSVFAFGCAALLAVAVLGVLQFALAAPPSPKSAAAAVDTKAEQAETITATHLPGRILDSNGAGIAQATIVPRVQEGIVPGWKVTTDRQGHYTFPPLKPGVRYELVTISAPGFLSREILHMRDRPSPDVTLQRAASIAGRVLGLDGKPLAGAPLALGLYSKFVGDFGNYRHAVSNAAGDFMIEKVPPGVAVVYYPGAAPPPYEREAGRDAKPLPPGRKWPAPPITDVFGSAVVELKDGERATNVVIDLSQSTCDVEGRVTGPDGKPLPGATVSAERYCHNLSFKDLIAQLPGSQIHAQSDQAGRFKLAHMPPGKWALSVWSPRFQRRGKVEYIDFVAKGQHVTRDLQVFERYEAENVLPERVAVEHAKTLAGLRKMRGFSFEIPSMNQAEESPYRFAELTVNSVPSAGIDVDALNLPPDATPEQIAKAAHVGELYYLAPNTLVTVNGTILAPCTLPEKNTPQETPLSRLSRLTRAQIEEQVRTSLRKSPPADGRHVAFKKGDWFIAVRDDGKAFLLQIGEPPSLSRDFVRVATYYIGPLELGPQAAEPPPAAKPATDAGPAATVEPAKTVHGKVVDENGKPISGADVWMAWDAWPEEPATHAICDAEGRFLLPVAYDAEHADPLQPIAGPGLVWAYAKGYQLGEKSAMEQIFGRDKSDVVIRLGPAVETPLVVLGPDNQPRAGDLVEPDRCFVSMVPKEVQSRVAARTDAKGRAVLTAIRRSDLHSVRIVSKDLGIQTQRLGKPSNGPMWPDNLPEGRPIRLRQAGRIVGHVTAQKPQWARNVRIILTSSPPLPPGPWPYSAESAPSGTYGYADVTSNEQGEFVVPAIAAGELSIDAFVDPKLPVLPRIPDINERSLAVHPGATTKLEIPLVRAVSVHGSVVAKDTGQPIAMRLIEILYGTEPRSLYRFSDAQGKFAFSVLPGRIQIDAPGPPRVSLPPDGHVQFGDSPEYNVPENVKEFQTPPLELVPTKSIRGSVIDEHDHPAANVIVHIEFDGRGYGNGQSNASGEFTLTGVPESIDMAKVKYQAVLWDGKPDGKWEEMEAKVVHVSPLVLRISRRR